MEKVAAGCHRAFYHLRCGLINTKLASILALHTFKDPSDAILASNCFNFVLSSLST
jgi:hypothetical protein